jgi:hypothetical protein
MIDPVITLDESGEMGEVVVRLFPARKCRRKPNDDEQTRVHAPAGPQSGAGTASLAMAQAPARGSVAELAYAGADRQQRLVDGARKEGNLAIYTRRRPTTSARWWRGTKKYGVKVGVWRRLRRAATW